MTFFLVPLGIAFDYIAIAVARIECILKFVRQPCCYVKEEVFVY